MISRHWAPGLLLIFAAVTLGLHSAARGEDFPPAEQLPSVKLPDPLVFFSGKKVEAPEQWRQERRLELQRLFQHYMYGYLPPKPDEVAYETAMEKAKIKEPGEQSLSYAAEFHLVTIHFKKPALTHQLHVLLILPENHQGPVPVFVGMNFCGNYALTSLPSVPLPASWVYPSCAGVEKERATEKGRGSQADVWNVDLILSRGYGLAAFYSGDLDPDTKEFTDGIEPAFYKPGQTTPASNDAGAIATWAWGYQRVVDYLVTRDDIDHARIAAVGHSRNGKTTLLAAAMDERIALAIPHQAGCGGTAPSRGTVGESVLRINTAFPHWFCDNFTLFNADTSRLPFDQHCLVALCAPRPVLFSNAQEDQWANPDGQFDVLKAATPVYKFLGADGLAAEAPAEPGKLIASRLGYYIRPGKHSMNRDDWKVFLDFADEHLRAGK